MLRTFIAVYLTYFGGVISQRVWRRTCCGEVTVTCTACRAPLRDSPRQIVPTFMPDASVNRQYSLLLLYKGR